MNHGMVLATDIERKTGHSGFSVQRYLSGFSKAIRFYNRGYSLPEIRELTDMSERLTKEYLDLYETCKDKPESKMRIESIKRDGDNCIASDQMAPHSRHLPDYDTCMCKRGAFGAGRALIIQSSLDSESNPGG